MESKEKLEEALKLALELEKANCGLCDKLKRRGFAQKLNTDLYYNIRKMSFLLADIQKIIKDLM